MLGRPAAYLRKVKCRHAAGLPAGPLGGLPWVKVGARLFLRESVLAATLASLDGTLHAMSSARIDAPSNAKREPAELRIVEGEQP